MRGLCFVFIVTALSAGELFAQGGQETNLPSPSSTLLMPASADAGSPTGELQRATPPVAIDSQTPVAPSPGGVVPEMSPLAWTKGDFTITPYGILWANMVMEAGRTTPGDYPLYVSRPRADANDDCYIDARSTRLGIDVLGPRIEMLDCAQSGGKVEIDFQRTIDCENKPSILLRHAYVEVKNDEFRLLAGQTWDVISPLCPGVLFYSVGWEGGNIGYRRPQLRAERYFASSDEVMFTAQGSLNTNVVSDTSFVGGSALASGWPLLEGRLALTLGQRGKGCLPCEFGVSSHVGDVIYDIHQNTPAAGSTYATSPFSYTAIGVDRPTWSLNVDARVPITSRFGVQGELFLGENLGAFLGGVGQSADVTGIWSGSTLVQAATGKSIRSRGGWIDVWYDWTPRLHSHVGYSIDDPFDSDVTSVRIYNAFAFSNVSFDLTSKFLVGFEYSFWRTIWDGPSVDATSQNFNLVAKYGF
jgi:hypothetical protein